MQARKLEGAAVHQQKKNVNTEQKSIKLRFTQQHQRTTQDLKHRQPRHHHLAVQYHTLS